MYISLYYKPSIDLQLLKDFRRRGVRGSSVDLEAQRFGGPRSGGHILGMIGRESRRGGYRLVRLEGGEEREPTESAEGLVHEVTMIRHVAWWVIGL